MSNIEINKDKLICIDEGFDVKNNQKVWGSESGSFDLTLSLFGGRFGKDENTPADEFLDDDCISNMVEGGLTLKVRYEMINNNSCKVFAKVE